MDVVLDTKLDIAWVLQVFARDCKRRQYKHVAHSYIVNLHHLMAASPASTPCAALWWTRTSNSYRLTFDGGTVVWGGRDQPVELKPGLLCTPSPRH